MGLRETINERPGAAMAVGGGLVAVALAALLSSAGDDSPGSSDNAFFSVDDGQTWFEEDVSKLPPFDEGGKQAVRAYVYEAGGTKFVNHLERYTAAGMKFTQEAAAAAKAGKPPPRAPQPGMTVMEVKRPGEAAWTPTSDMRRAAPIMSPKLPPGVSGEATPVEP